MYYLKYMSFTIHLFLLFGPIALKKKLGWFGLQKTETKLKLKQNIFHINVIISHSKYTYLLACSIDKLKFSLGSHC